MGTGQSSIQGEGGLVSTIELFSTMPGRQTAMEKNRKPVTATYNGRLRETGVVDFGSE